MSKVLSPLVSVIITCYNDGDYIDEAIDSVKQSTLQNIELIIVDDCSTEMNTIAKLKQLVSQNYQVFICPKNKGVGNARNTGIEKANGQYILTLDADDRLLPAYLEKAANVLNANPSTALVYCNVKRFGLLNSTRVAPEFSLPTLLAGNYIASASMFRKSNWQNSGGFDTQMPNYEDWEFWITLSKSNMHFHHINEVLFEYRAKGNSKISRTLQAEHRANVVMYVIKKHLPLYQQHVASIVSYLHQIITNNEALLSKQELLISNNGASDLFQQLAFAQDELTRRTAYYENSFFWKLKKLADKFKW